VITDLDLARAIIYIQFEDSPLILKKPTVEIIKNDDSIILKLLAQGKNLSFEHFILHNFLAIINLGEIFVRLNSGSEYL
jgi:hypothetical protein